VVCIFHIVGKKDTGKTSVIEKAVKIIKNKGNYKIAVFKHSHHLLDLAGKDTDRFREAGSDYIVFQEGERQSVLFMPNVLSSSLIDLLPVDIIFIEGFTYLELGKKYFIQSSDEVDEVVNRILSDLEECNRVKGFLHLDENKLEVNSEKPLLLLLYNLLKALGIRNVTLD